MNNYFCSLIKFRRRCNDIHFVSTSQDQNLFSELYEIIILVGFIINDKRNMMGRWPRNMMGRYDGLMGRGGVQNMVMFVLKLLPPEHERRDDSRNYH